MITKDLVWVHRGPKGQVALTQAVSAAFDSCDAKPRAKISRFMQLFCEGGPKALHKEVFRHEGRFSSGGAGAQTIPIYAFKGWQVRVYGSIETISKIPTFVGTEIDASKKKDKADQKALKRAAKKIGELRR